MPGESEGKGTPEASEWDSWSALAVKVAFLQRPESFPEPTTSVEAVETHMSWVFLTDDYVYKFKKPVHFELVNLVTLEDRRRNCEEELRWNRRLAPDVYLGIVPLGLDEAGRLGFGSRARVVDWLVKMRRLPGRLMLDRVIARGEVERAEIRGLAESLTAFYRRARQVGIGAEEYRARFVKDVADIVRALESLSTIPKNRIEGVSSSLLGFLSDGAPLLDARVRGGRIVEAHGDLRPEHVCLLPDPVVIDCLEFNQELRSLDPADELSFLALECERLGGPAFIETVLFDTYTRETDDDLPRALVRFYKAYRAFLRAKIAIWHVRDPEVKNPTHWVARAADYLAAAESLVDESRDTENHSERSSTKDPPL